MEGKMAVWIYIHAFGAAVPLAAYGHVKKLAAQLGATNKPVINAANSTGSELAGNSPLKLYAPLSPEVHVSIDTLRLVHNVDTADLYGLIGKNLETHDGPDFAKASAKQASKQGYYRGYSIISAGKEAATLYSGRIGVKDSRQLALHLQVSRLPGINIGALAEPIATIMPGGLGAFMSQAHISEIDVAVDVNGIGITDLILNHAHAQQWHKVGKFKSGVQTIYFGSNNSKSRWRIYDRTAHLNGKGYPKLAKSVRFEKHMRGPMSFAEFGALNNQLSDLSVLEVQKYSPSDAFSPLERDLIKMLFHHNAWPDMQSALAAQPLLSKILKLSLLVSTANWWKPADYWSLAKVTLEAAVKYEPKLQQTLKLSA
jgi:hypothetical protein